MNKSTTAAEVAASVLTAFAANAATTSGVVQSVDTARDSIRMTDGSNYTLAEGSETEDFKPGTKVTITYAKRHGENVASSVKIMK